MFFFKNHTENEAGRLDQDLFCFSKKVLFEVKGSGKFFLYALLTDEISLFDCLCFSRYWAIFALQLLLPRL